VRKAFKAMRDLDLDAIAIQNAMHTDANFFYYTGIPDGIFENATIIMRPPDRIELISYILEKESAAGGDYELTLHDSRDGSPIVLERLQGCKRIGLNPNVLPLAKYKRLEKGLQDADFVDISKELNAIRLIKDSKEIGLMRRSARIASKVADEIPGMLRPGMTESALAADITAELLKKGSSKLAFDTIVCFGPNSAVAHHIGGDAPLKKGQFIICDYGGAVSRYSSDITRTWVFGKATAKQKRIYNAVKKAQKVAFDTMKEGVNGMEVHRKVDDSITRSGFKGKFTHSTGHALGLDVHDCGVAIHTEIDLEMKKGMVFTVEPGIYLSGYGGVRIEDDVVVRKEGVDILTTADRRLQEVVNKR
jgi:Xaa-Pro dipeptidase